MICPLRMIAYQQEGRRSIDSFDAQVHRGDTVARCLEGDCAWYDMNEETCCIFILASALKNVIDSIDAVGVS